MSKSKLMEKEIEYLKVKHDFGNDLIKRLDKHILNIILGTAIIYFSALQIIKKYQWTVIFLSVVAILFLMFHAWNYLRKSKPLINAVKGFGKELDCKYQRLINELKN